MLRRITLSLAFAASIGVASAQLVPNSAWSIFAPSGIPTVEWSSNGSYVLFTSNSAVELMNGSTMQLIWSRTTTATEPTFLAGYSDLAHFSPDGTSVWIRTASGGSGSTFTQVSTTTGLPLLSHTFSDWTADYQLVPVGKELVAYNVSLSGSTYTYNLRTYDSTSLALLTTNTLTHGSGGGLSVAAGVYGSADTAFFFNKGVNTRTGAVTTFGTSSAEAWTLAADPQGGLLQEVVDVSGSTYTPAGSQRITSSGTTWSSSSSFPGALGGFLSSTSSPVAIGKTTTGISAFNYLTGASLWSTSVETGGVAVFNYQPQALNPVSGNLILPVGTSGFSQAVLDSYTVSTSALGSPTSLNAIIYGLSAVAPVSGGSGGGTFVTDPYDSVLMSLTSTASAPNWKGTTYGGPFHVATSPAGDFLAYATTSGLFIVNATTGAAVTSYGGSFSAVSWGTEASGTSTLLASETNSQAIYFTFNGTSLTVTKNYGVSDFHVAGHALTSDGKWALGYANQNIYVFDLAHLLNPPTQTAYPNYTTAWDDSFQIVQLSNGNLAFLEQTTGGAQWTVYSLSSSSGSGSTITPVTSYTYTPPFTRAAGDRIRGAISPDLAVAAFFEGTSIGTNGTPTSELAFVRLKDGKVLETIDNVFSYVSSMALSPDKSVLYVTTGGPSYSGSVTLAESGPTDLQAINVPTWITSISASPTSVNSGKSTQVTVTLDIPAGVGGQVVNLAGSTGMTVPSTMTIPAGQTSAAVTVTCPVVSSTTTCTVTASIPGLGESSSVTITDAPPLLSTITLNPSTVQAGFQSTGTITLTGNAPSGGWTINLSQSPASLVGIPASVKVPAGSSSTTFTITTTASSAGSTANITAQDVGVNDPQTAALTITQTVIDSLTFEATSITGGDAVAATVTIAAPAPTGGLTLTLTGSSTLSFPATVTIPAGKTSIEITGTTSAVGSSTTDTLTVKLGSATAQANVTLLPPTIKAVEFAQHTIVGGTSAKVVVLLSGVAASGTTLSLTSSNSALNAPATAAFTTGSTSTILTIPTTTVTTNASAKLTVTLGSSSGSDTITIHT